MSVAEVKPGDRVRVVSGPHEGRRGTVLTTRLVSAGMESQEYALINSPGDGTFQDLPNEIVVSLGRLERQ